VWSPRECIKKWYVSSSKEDLWPTKFTLELSIMLVLFIGWEQLNSWAPSWILMPKCAKTIISQPPCIWSMQVFHISNHKYTENSLNITSFQMSNWMVGWAQGPLSHEQQKTFYFYKKKHHWGSCKVLHWNGKTLIEVNALTWAPNTT
jgi:hypothetical protein